MWCVAMSSSRAVYVPLSIYQSMTAVFGPPFTRRLFKKADGSVPNDRLNVAESPASALVFDQEVDQLGSHLADQSHLGLLPVTVSW